MYFFLERIFFSRYYSISIRHFLNTENRWLSIGYFPINNKLMEKNITNLLLLAIPPNPGHSLIVIGWIPIGIEHHQPVCTNQIQATATGLATQHKQEITAL